MTSTKNNLIEKFGLDKTSYILSVQNTFLRALAYNNNFTLNDAIYIINDLLHTMQEVQKNDNK